MSRAGNAKCPRGMPPILCYRPRWQTLCCFWIERPILPDHQLVVFAQPDDYFFGVLHGAIHELWARHSGTQLREAESGFRYTPTTCFETFPLPWPPSQEPTKDKAYRRIAKAAEQLNEQRERWLNPPEWIDPIAQLMDRDDDFADVPPEARALIRQSAIMARAAKDARLKKRTLTNLYNERPTWLKLTHAELDRAVLAAYAAVDPDGTWDEAGAEVWVDSRAGLSATRRARAGGPPQGSGPARLGESLADEPGASERGMNCWAAILGDCTAHNRESITLVSACSPMNSLLLGDSSGVVNSRRNFRNQAQFEYPLQKTQ